MPKHSKKYKDFRRRNRVYNEMKSFKYMIENEMKRMESNAEYWKIIAEGDDSAVNSKNRNNAECDLRIAKHALELMNSRKINEASIIIRDRAYRIAAEDLLNARWEIREGKDDSVDALLKLHICRMRSKSFNTFSDLLRGILLFFDAHYDFIEKGMNQNSEFWKWYDSENNKNLYFD